MLSNEFSLPFKEKISYFLTFPDYMMELSPLSNPWMKSFFRDQNTPVYRPRWLPESQDLTSAKVKNQIHRANIALCQNTTVFQEKQAPSYSFSAGLFSASYLDSQENVASPFPQMFDGIPLTL